MKLVKYTAFAAIFLVSGLQAQKKPQGLPKDMVIHTAPKFVEEVKKVGKEIVIPYKRYVMANGMQIIIHEDHSDPIVYVDVTYHVGSAREQQGRSGFAHFFEHMMFQGSKNVADEQHFKIITEAGGTLNGTTNTDRTNYFEVVPSNQFEKMLWLESDLTFRDPITIEGNVLLNDANVLFKKTNVDTIVVTDNGKPVGMLDIQDLKS